MAVKIVMMVSLPNLHQMLPKSKRPGGNFPVCHSVLVCGKAEHSSILCGAGRSFYLMVKGRQKERENKPGSQTLLS